MNIEKLKSIIEKELNTRKVYEDALDVVRSLEGLGQYEKETKANIVKAVTELDTVKVELKYVLQSVAEAKSAVSNVKAKAQEQADDIVAKARAEADAITAAAQLELANITSQVVYLSGEVEGLQEARHKAQAELDAVEKALSSTKGKLKAFVGD